MQGKKRELVSYVRESVIGSDTRLDGPFGPTRLIYADYTASGRCLNFIEDYLTTQVMPFYANTHTMMSGTGRQTTALREQARAIIRDAVGADERDVVLFCGSGATAAIHQMIGVLGLRKQGDESVEKAETNNAVVFIGPYEHHSNILPW